MTKNKPKISKKTIKVLILGSNGLLGNAFIRFLEHQKGVKLILPKHQECDITSKQQLAKFFLKFRPNLVINCVADLNQDLMENKPERGFAVNILGVYFLAQLCKTYNCEFIHFGSTVDQEVTSVYSLTKYLANFVPNGIGLKKYYIYRLGWLFGDPTLKKKSFTSVIIKALEEGRELGLTDNRFVSPTYIKDVVEYCWQKFIKKEYGIYPLTNKGRVTIWQFANVISQFLGIKHKFYINNNYQEVAKRCVDASSNKNCLRPYRQALKEFIYEYQSKK